MYLIDVCDTMKSNQLKAFWNIQIAIPSPHVYNIHFHDIEAKT